jgi:hypothetical protein
MPVGHQSQKYNVSTSALLDPGLVPSVKGRVTPGLDSSVRYHTVVLSWRDGCGQVGKVWALICMDRQGRARLSKQLPPSPRSTAERLISPGHFIHSCATQEKMKAEKENQ